MIEPEDALVLQARHPGSAPLAVSAPDRGTLSSREAYVNRHRFGPAIREKVLRELAEEW
jgi:hypothetical protein